MSLGQCQELEKKNEQLESFHQQLRVRWHYSEKGAPGFCVASTTKDDPHKEASLYIRAKEMILANSGRRLQMPCWQVWCCLCQHDKRLEPCLVRPVLTVSLS